MLSINPVEGSIPANKELKIRHGMIVIKGEADVPGAVILLSPATERRQTVCPGKD
ncbi:MAG: hypothetical protein AB2L24_23785 [Mangrovibacterium sp.]